MFSIILPLEERGEMDPLFFPTIYECRRSVLPLSVCFAIFSVNHSNISFLFIFPDSQGEDPLSVVENSKKARLVAQSNTLSTQIYELSTVQPGKVFIFLYTVAFRFCHYFHNSESL